MEHPKVSQTSNKVSMKGFIKYTYTVPKQTCDKMSYLVPIHSKLFMHFSYIYLRNSIPWIII